VDGRATAPAVGPLGPYRNPLMDRTPDVSSETDWVGNMPPGRARTRKGTQATGRETCRLPSLSFFKTIKIKLIKNNHDYNFTTSRERKLLGAILCMDHFN
jgi:hypothetical protein